MAVNNFAIGQRVRVVRVGEWNGTPPDTKLTGLVGYTGPVVEIRDGTIGVLMRGTYWTLGVLQFLPDELEALDESSGGRVE